MLVKDQAALDAADVLTSYGDSRYPVDATAIAVAMGMQVLPFWLPDDVSGMLQVQPDQTPRIYVDSRHVPQRRNFTIAHEIGHYVERTSHAPARDVADFNFIDRRGGPYDLHEFYADEFAGNLLMPLAEIQHARSNSKLGLVGLARHFGVSLQAMRHRLERLQITA